MSDVKRRVTRLEAQTGGDDHLPRGPFIYRPGESQAETLARYGLSPEAIEGRATTVWLPETEMINDEFEQAGNEGDQTGGPGR